MNDPTTPTDIDVSEFLNHGGYEYGAVVCDYDAWYGDDVAGIDSDPSDLGDSEIPF